LQCDAVCCSVLHRDFESVDSHVVLTVTRHGQT